MDEIVEKNLKLMKGTERGGMLSVLSEESYGGNAGFWLGYSCAATNFYYDSSTGEIKYFGNFPDVPRKMNSFEPGYFRIALGFSKGLGVEADFQDHIVACLGLQNASGNARKNLEETVRLFNQEFGLSEEKLEELKDKKDRI